MKSLVKKLARHAQRLPGLGRLVRIAAAVVRLPELRAEVIGLASGSYEHGPRNARPALWRALEELRENTAGDANLARSVPVALRRLTREVHDLRQRLDAAGLGADGAAASPGAGGALLFVVPQPATPADGLRLYLGHGEPAPAGYVSAGPDAAGGALPAAPGSAAEILVAYQLESYAQDELRGRVLPALHAVLRPGARLRVLASDAGAALAAYAGGACGYEQLRATLYGAAGQDGGLRLNMLSPASLAALLEEAGFAVGHTAQTGMRGERPYTFEIVADRPMPRPAAH